MKQPLKRLWEFVLTSNALGTGIQSKWDIFWKQTKNIRVRLHLARYHPDEIYSLPTTYGKLYFRDNFGDITNLSNLLFRQVYRVQVVPQEGVILDIGANIGLAAVWFAHHNPSKTIYCLEPLPSNAKMIALNCPNARVEQVAVGATRGRVALQVDAAGVMASNIATAWETREDCFDVISLDEFTKEHNLEKIALIKMDTEGMELEIFRGGQETLRRTQQLVMETHGHFCHDESMKHVSEAGFRIEDAPFDGHTGMIFASR